MHGGTIGVDGLSWQPSGSSVAHGEIVVYTAITRDYDDLKEQPRTATDGATFVAFLDEPKESRTWRSYPISRHCADPVRNAKIHKILPHVFFPNAKYSLWIDGSVSIRFDHRVEPLIERYLADCDLVVFQHRVRTCVYQEASVCLQRGLDDPNLIWQQICRYTREGYAANAGLAECPVILRRHNAAVRVFDETWWEEIRRGSRRDQLSFGYVARKVGLRYRFFPGTIADSPLFHRACHIAGAVIQRPAPIDGAPASRDVHSPDRPVFPACHSSPPTRGRVRKTIAFGCVSDKPSWSWAGFDVARQLSHSYDVALYRASATPPDCDVAFVIKKRPSDQFVDEALRRGTKLVYCPIDAYRSAEEIDRDAELLRACALIVVHCERLLPVMRRYGARVEFVEHHSRHALPDMADYRDRGFVLWIGSCQYVPYLTNWLERHPLVEELRILTDIDNAEARAKAHEHAAEIGMNFSIAADTTSVAGCRIHRWSERRQRDMMRACRAALDVKMTAIFNQYHKPPTKAQQFVSSAIPFAVNADSYSAEYFCRRGFDVASPLETDRWLSREYWEATRAAARRLRAATSIGAVGARYRELIDSL